jgi:acyl carrier protein
MSLQDFIQNFADAVEVDVDSIGPNSVFKDIDSWDSMAVLNIIAMVDDKYQKTIGGDEIENSVTVVELWEKIKA